MRVSGFSFALSLPDCRPASMDFSIQRNGGLWQWQMPLMLVLSENVRQPSFRHIWHRLAIAQTSLALHSPRTNSPRFALNLVFRTFSSIHIGLMPLQAHRRKRIEKNPRTREAARLQTKGKSIQLGTSTTLNFAAMEYSIEPIPTWALLYLINSDPSGLNEEEIGSIEKWCRESHLSVLGTATDEEGECGPYFTHYPAFGLPADVMDCHVIIH